MNCANHADASAVAYCRTCGKALCANCTRPVRGVIYCEDCLGARMEGAAGRSGGGLLRSRTRRQRSGQVPPAAAEPAAGRTRPWPEFWPDSFPSAWARSTPGNMPRDWRIWPSLHCSSRDATPADNDHSTALGVICGLGIDFLLRLPDHRLGALGQGDSDGAYRFRIRTVWRQRLAAGRRLRRARFRWARLC